MLATYFQVKFHNTILEALIIASDKQFFVWLLYLGQLREGEVENYNAQGVL